MHHTHRRFPRATLLLGTALALAACSPSTSPGDGGGIDAGGDTGTVAEAGALAVSISSPDQTAHTNGTVTIQVVVLGGQADSVDILRDGAPLAAALPPPYQYAWDTTSVTEGSYEITARANRGALSWQSAPRTVVVDRTRPMINMRVPAPAATDVLSRATITATASEPLLASTVNSASVTLAATTGGALAHNVALSADGTTITVTPTDSFALPNTLTVSLAGSITDLAGNALVAPADPWSWDVPAWLPRDGGLPPAASNAYAPRLTVDPTGTAWATWVEGATGLVAVRKWTATGATWEPVGAPFAGPSGVSVDTPAIAVGGDGVATVALSQAEGAGTQQATNVRVMQFAAGATAWAPLGGAINTYATTPALSPVVALDSSGAPVVAWQDSLSTFTFVGAVRWSGASWDDLMSPINDPPTASPALFPALAADPTGSVVAAFVQGGGTSNDVLVRRFDGTAWTTLGAPLSAAPGATSATGVDVAVDASGGVFVAWTEPATVGGDAQVFVQAYRSGAFVALGAALDGDPQSGTPALGPSVRLDATGAPVLAWVEGGRVFVRRWSGSAWDVVGGGSLAASQSGATVSNVTLGVLPGGAPLVLWAEGAGGQSTLHARALNQ